ncbi:MAG: hypothetical protein FWD71_09650 [Oscillospiraceae bacterium]|nr:hypothetical protein [Oscillospiraceae bacterium]
MDFLKEVVLEGLKIKKTDLSFLCANVYVEKTDRKKLHEILVKINRILENDDLSGLDLTEEIIRVFDCAEKR